MPKMEDRKARAQSIGADHAKHLKKQPSPNTPNKILETFVEEKTEGWREAFIHGFWKEVESSSWQAHWPSDGGQEDLRDGENKVDEDYAATFGDSEIIDGLERLSQNVEDSSEEADEASSITLAPDVVPDLLVALDLDKNQEVAETAIKLAETHGTTGDSVVAGAPSSIAAASVYIAALLKDEHRTQEEVADEADVTPPTLRDKFHKILETYQ